MRALLLPGSRIYEAAFGKDALHQLVAEQEPDERDPDLLVVIVGMPAADSCGSCLTDERVQTKYDRQATRAAETTVDVELHGVGVGRRVRWQD